MRKCLSALMILALAEVVLAVQRPSLVLWITVDQLRGDMPGRYIPVGREGAFSLLRSRGLYYTSAYYQHATTFTAVGHAVLFTGGHAAGHGIAGNDWRNVETGKRVYCVQDDRYPLIGEQPAEGAGRSPNNLTSSTVGDEMVWASGGRSRVFAVSGKDRGAIIPAGHLGKAFWYSNATGEFVTSTYYYSQYPDWAADWNKGKPADRYLSQTWSLTDDADTYIHREEDDRSCEKGYKYLNRVFPHAMKTEKMTDFYGAIRYTPFMDEMTLAFAREALERERLGLGPAPDFLSVSLSALDYIGHNWGPESLEAEDHVRRVDAMLGEFLQFVDQAVGLDKTLIVLSSDHGMDEIPECRQAMGFDAGRHSPDKIIKSLNEALRVRLQIDRDLVVAFWNPSVYLDADQVAALGLDLAVVEKMVAEEIMRMPGFALAVTRTDILAGRVVQIPVAEQLVLSFHPKRSGHVLTVVSPFWYLYSDPVEHAAMHGSPHSYDTFVPMLLCGPGISPAIVRHTVAPESLAPSVAHYLGLKPPSGCTSSPLAEVPVGLLR
ncbi:MAG: alkaline phosphatase family protein [Phycisphaerae bacterium]